MFCPKCGAEAVDGQKFCKSCGTNMQVVSDAITGNEDALEWNKLRLELDDLKKGAVNWARDFKTGVGGTGRGHLSAAGTRRMRRETRERSTRERSISRRTPKPREWLRYSWQHNLRDGLISLMAGAGISGLLYFLGHAAIDAGTISDLESRWNTHGLVQLTSLIWLVGAVRALKGVGQIIYSAFADSIATLNERFMPPATAEQQPLPAQPTVRTNELVPDSPPSVTEHTTHILEDAPAKIGIEGQSV